MNSVWTCSRGILTNRSLPTFLSSRRIRRIQFWAKPRNCDVVIGWGKKANTAKARDFATKRNLLYLHLEDGFLGYIGHPADKNHHRLSVIKDEVGIYYDATSPSALEQYIDTLDWFDDEMEERATTLLSKITTHGLTKYNCYSNHRLPFSLSAKLNGSKGIKVLVIDQTFGDSSIKLGLGNNDSFADMLTAAQAEHRDADIYVRTHPDVLKGTKKGYLTDINTLKAANITLLADPCPPLVLLEQFDHIYTVTSQLGFEALLLGKPVTCFGVPFYAGWGLTDDRASVPRRGKTRSLIEVFAAAYIQYPTYVDPTTGLKCKVEDIIDLILTQRLSPQQQRFHQLYCIGFSLWKRVFVKRFASKHAKQLRFVNSVQQLPKTDGNSDAPYGDGVLVWGRKHDRDLAQNHVELPVLRMEDGFIRSVGLGSNLMRPGSLVLDGQGIYYDPTESSALASFLKHHQFSQEERRRGREVLQLLKELKISKYNLAGTGVPDFKRQADGRKIILVPGQVEDDASIMLGGAGMSNLELLMSARSNEPGAFIIYKGHPDVMAGNRAGNIPEDQVLQYADLVLNDVNISDCLQRVDAVNTITSQTGFEALIHQKEVVTYGQPFYAGWGLTQDQSPMTDRGRPLSIDELCYGALIWYPSYFDWKSGLFISASRQIHLIQQQRKSHQCEPKGWRGWCEIKSRKLRYLFQALFDL